MAAYELIIKGGRVATAKDVTRCDIGIRGGRIVALAESLDDADEIIDAKGRWVTPGGVDAHCHLDQPAPDGSVCADGFRTGTRSAAAGGTTTVIPFAIQLRGQSLRDAVNDYHRRADGEALVDYAFHMIVTDPGEQALGQELPALIRDGYTSFKIYMTYDALKLSDRQILEVMSVARAHGALVMMHAENADATDWLTEQLELSGRTAPKYHATARPLPVEREATHRAISLAQLADVPLLIVHISGSEIFEQVRWARSRGLRIFAETCPHYLLLTADDLEQPGFEGAKCICSPPPRTAAEHAAVWTAIQDGTVDVFSSDHAPARYDDPKGKKLHGEGAPFRQVPNGIPGLETRLPLLFSEGVMKGRIDITRFVELTSTRPAWMYGLLPRKGTIAVGSDADLVIWDTDTPVTIANAHLHHAVDYTPYEGVEVQAWPAVTVARGEVVWREGGLSGAVGRGRFLRCETPPAAVPPGRPTPFLAT